MRNLLKLIYEFLFGTTVKKEYVPIIQFPIPQEVLSDKEMEMIQLINNHRTEIGLQPFKTSTHLWGIASQKSREMKFYNEASHDGFQQRYIDSEALIFGENVSKGYSTAKDNFNAYMNSKGHRALLENSFYEYIAISDMSNFNTILAARYRNY